MEQSRSLSRIRDTELHFTQCYSVYECNPYYLVFLESGGRCHGIPLSLSGGRKLGTNATASVAGLQKAADWQPPQDEEPLEESSLLRHDMRGYRPGFGNNVRGVPRYHSVLRQLDFTATRRS